MGFSAQMPARPAAERDEDAITAWQEATWQAVRKEVFADWGQGYNTIIGVGDVTGDGKADLLERDSAGNVRVNPGHDSGTFGARIKVGAGWQNYLNLY
ncbi:winged helix-turn-helix domain-containing protein [Streptomyces sp. NPDC051104]|uniref:winged helix-turn-helix domain-containing protein n=1 Tax=Streptomyces sp. NPDC051104 TaxID=3155044 RepID=UPI0034265941